MQPWPGAIWDKPELNALPCRLALVYARSCSSELASSACRKSAKEPCTRSSRESSGRLRSTASLKVNKSAISLASSSCRYKPRGDGSGAGCKHRQACRNTAGGPVVAACSRLTQLGIRISRQLLHADQAPVLHKAHAPAVVSSCNFNELLERRGLPHIVYSCNQCSETRWPTLEACAAHKTCPLAAAMRAALQSTLVMGCTEGTGDMKLQAASPSVSSSETPGTHAAMSPPGFTAALQRRMAAAAAAAAAGTQRGDEVHPRSGKSGQRGVTLHK